MLKYYISSRPALQQPWATPAELVAAGVCERMRLTVVSVEGLKLSTSNGGFLGALQSAFTSSSDTYYYAVLLWNGCTVGRTHSVARSSDSSSSSNSSSSGREVQWNSAFDIAVPLQQHTTTNTTAVKITFQIYSDTATNSSSSSKHSTAVLIGEATVRGTADAFIVCNGASGRVLELPLLHSTAATTAAGTAKAVAKTEVGAVCGRTTIYLHRAAADTHKSGADCSAANECTDSIAVAAAAAAAAAKSLNQQTATISDNCNSSSCEIVLHVSGVTWPGQLPAQQCSVTVKLNGRTLHRVPAPLYIGNCTTVSSYTGAYGAVDTMDSSSVNVHAAAGDELSLEVWYTTAKDSDVTATSTTADTAAVIDVFLGESRMLLTENALKALLQGSSVRRRLQPKQALLLLQQATVLPLLHSSSTSSSSDSSGYVYFTLQPVAVPLDYSTALQRSYNERGLQAVVTLQAAAMLMPVTTTVSTTDAAAGSHGSTAEQVLVKVEFRGTEVWRSSAIITQGRVTFDDADEAHNVAPAHFVLPLEEVSYIDFVLIC
jgi:hypothetical protein